jgi:hypothetical protein
VKRGKYKIPDHVSDQAKDLIDKILVVDPKERYKVTLINLVIDPIYLH